MPVAISGISWIPNKNYSSPFFVYPEGPHRGGFKKAINFNSFPQQAHLMMRFLSSGVSGNSAVSQKFLPYAGSLK
jgi:hypothetical protein